MSISAAVAGATGLGAHITTQLLANPSVSSVISLTRRKHEIPEVSPKYNNIVNAETSTWYNEFHTALKNAGTSIAFSGLGSTRAQAGGLENQRKIDVDLNYDLAKAAKETGTVKTYVLISSGGADSKSFAPYMKMKGELEDKLIGLKFERTVILRPGFLMGDRGERSRMGEGLAIGLVNATTMLLGNWLKDKIAAEGPVVARAAIKAGLAQGADWKGDENGVWIVDQSEVIRLGKSE
ncbi:hypothetical protein BJ508DRAFT_112670 [Ascobolus immersus RN42]|uniref:NAD(P)-binding domain-containing protein n=1 Tax=Ascobolus immersus RN42 TaxID=1160509 RepID=A0A3N4IBI4_ASCIM|nr:hypothetical protein BJ508DRAFT_112670 [Ascobolus immersus RN42]